LFLIDYVFGAARAIANWRSNGLGFIGNPCSRCPLQSVIASLRSNLTTTGFSLQSGLLSQGGCVFGNVFNLTYFCQMKWVFF